MASFVFIILCVLFFAAVSTGFVLPASKSSCVLHMSTDGGLSRRELFSAAAKSGAAFGLASAFATGAAPMASAIGPVKMPLTNIAYQAVDCKGKELSGGSFTSKSTAGLVSYCVEVTADVFNPEKKTIIDASVFGFVFDNTGSSVVLNNPDARSDAGQFAIIPKIVPGKSNIKFEMVAAVPSERGDVGELRFESIKAISYPGGDRYKAISDCDFNPSGDGCDEEEDD